MKSLEDRHEVVASLQLGVGSVRDRERDPVRHSGVCSMPGAQGHRIGIEVEAIDGDPRVCLRHGDAGPPGAAPHIRHSCRRLVAKPPIDLKDGGQPLLAQEVEEDRTVEFGSTLWLPRQRRRRLPRPERVHKLWQWAPRTDDVHPLVRLVAEVVHVGEDRDVRGWHAVAAQQRIRRRIVDVQQPARRLMLEPFPDVPLIGGGPFRQLRGGGPATLGEVSIET
jgi:hypothetical protein